MTEVEVTFDGGEQGGVDHPGDKNEEQHEHKEKDRVHVDTNTLSKGLAGSSLQATQLHPPGC